MPASGSPANEHRRAGADCDDRDRSQGDRKSGGPAVVAGGLVGRGDVVGV
jgi:hypothetical protein